MHQFRSFIILTDTFRFLKVYLVTVDYLIIYLLKTFFPAWRNQRTSSVNCSFANFQKVLLTQIYFFCQIQEWINCDPVDCRIRLDVKEMSALSRIKLLVTAMPVHEHCRNRKVDDLFVEGVSESMERESAGNWCVNSLYLNNIFGKPKKASIMVFSSISALKEVLQENVKFMSGVVCAWWMWRNCVNNIELQKLRTSCLWLSSIPIIIASENWVVLSSTVPKTSITNKRPLKKIECGKTWIIEIRRYSNY